MLLNLIKRALTDIDKICLNVKDPLVPVKRREKLGIKNTKHPKPSIDYSQNFGNVYENLEDQN